MDEQRYIINPSPDWTAFKVHLQKTESSNNAKYSGTLECDEILQKSRTWLKGQIKDIEKCYPCQSDIAPSSNPRKSTKYGSIYTGAGGNAFMYWRLSCFYKLEGDKDQSFDYLMKALEAINVALMIPNNTGVAFYYGMSGNDKGVYSISLVYTPLVMTIEFLKVCVIVGVAFLEFAWN